MEVRVQDTGPAEPFLGARDLFETEYDLEHPVYVRIRDDPDERTWTGHADSYHVLSMSRHAAHSAMVRELALHEFAHMHRYEQEHPSHHQPTEEAIYLGLAGETVERHKLTHCYQIANHMKDIYADDITLTVGPPTKIVAFLESQLANALLDRPAPVPSTWRQESGRADVDITAVNAAFAVALCERHGLVGENHRLYDLAESAAHDAPDIDFDRFRRHFKSLTRNPDRSEYRKALVEITREYCVQPERAAD